MARGAGRRDAGASAHRRQCPNSERQVCGEPCGKSTAGIPRRCAFGDAGLAEAEEPAGVPTGLLCEVFLLGLCDPRRGSGLGSALRTYERGEA